MFSTSWHLRKYFPLFHETEGIVYGIHQNKHKSWKKSKPMTTKRDFCLWKKNTFNKSSWIVYYELGSMLSWIYFLLYCITFTSKPFFLTYEVEFSRHKLIYSLWRNYLWSGCATKNALGTCWFYLFSCVTLNAAGYVRFWEIFAVFHSGKINHSVYEFPQ